MVRTMPPVDSLHCLPSVQILSLQSSRKQRTKKTNQLLSFVFVISTQCEALCLMSILRLSQLLPLMSSCEPDCLHFPVMALHYFRNFYFSVGTQCCVHPVLPLLQFFLQSCLCFVKCPQRFKNPCFMDLTFNKDRASSWYFNLLWSLKLQLMP